MMAIPQPAETSATIVDIEVAVNHIRERERTDQIALMGWATGSQWLAQYAATQPEHVSHLVLYNSLWPVSAPWPMGDSLEDQEKPGNLRNDPLLAYARATAESLLGRWTQSIPDDDPDGWRDPEVATAYVNTAIAANPASANEDPPVLRVPLGALADSFLLSRGHRLFDPARISANVLIVRSQLDFWSRPADPEGARSDLVHAGNVQSLSLPGATHFAHLDRPERGRGQLLNAVTQFLEDR